MPLTMPENLADLEKYARLLLKRKWTILLCIVLVTGFTAYRIYKESETWFFSSASLVMQSSAPQAFNIENVFQRNPWMGGFNPQAMQNAAMMKMQLLNSRILAKRVLEKLHLDQSPEFIDPPSRSIKHYLGKIVPQGIRKKTKKSLRGIGEQMGLVKSDPSLTDAELEEQRKVSEHIDGYMSRIQVNPEGMLVRVTFTGRDPLLPQIILQAHLETFIELDLELKFETSDEAKEWINNKLIESKNNLIVSELNLAEFVNENDIAGIDPQSAGQGQTMLGDLEHTLFQFDHRKLQSEFTLDILREIQKDTSNVLLYNFFSDQGVGDNGAAQEVSAELSALRSNYVNLSSHYTKLSLIYGPDHPKIIEVQKQMKDLDKKIKQNVALLIKGYHRAMEQVLEFEKNLRDKVEAYKDRDRAVQKLVGRLEILNSEVESNKEAYNAILSKAKIANLMGNVQESSLMSGVKIFDAPTPPQMVPESKKLMKLGKAAGMGFFLGIALVLLLEFFDNVFRNPEDIERFFKVAAFLGPFPQLDIAQDYPEQNLGESFLALEDASSLKSESIRNIRTNLVFSFSDRQSHSMLFTSPAPMDGKSTVIAHVAVSFAKLGKKTILIDADLRRPSLHHIFGIENVGGLSDVLIGEMEENEAIRPSKVPGLDLVTCGTIPPNPSELLGSTFMADFISKLKKSYEIILFDTPPILSVMDALVLGKHMDGIGFVVRSGTTTIPSLKNSMETTNKQNIRILGIILNDYNVEVHYHSYYHYASQVEEDMEEIESPKHT